jgi:hypothetical protein
MNAGALHQILRVRCKADLEFLRDGLCDEVIINANLLQNDPQSTTTALGQTSLPVSVDPVLYRFQRPEWWRNAKGEAKRNFVSLGNTYAKGTGIDLPAAPLMSAVAEERTWRVIARNVIEHQQSCLPEIPIQLDLLASVQPRPLHAVRTMAPALVAHTRGEDAVNRTLAEASAEASPAPVALAVIVPPERLLDPRERSAILGALPSEHVGSYFIWTPGVSEERLLREPALIPALLRLIDGLRERGIAVGHMHAGYAIASLHELGLDALVHTLSWTDGGEPAAKEGSGGPRSCRVYVPGVRYCLRFHRAHWLGRTLDRDEYARRFCDCAFCMGAFAEGEHPLDRLLGEQQVTIGHVTRGTPTHAAVKLNTWHYLFSRRQEIQAFSQAPAREVIERDIQRAGLMADPAGTARLRRLAGRLRTA